MKILFAIVMIIAMVYSTSCAHDQTEEKPQPVVPEINMNPILLPTEKQPDIIADMEGIRFSWPDQKWLLMKEETGLYAVAKDLTYQVDLQPKRPQIQEIPLPRQKDEASREAFEIIDLISVKEGVLLVTEHNNVLYGLAHLRQIMDAELVWLIRDADEIPEYILSQDKSKVAFWKPEGHLGTYSTVTGRNTSLPEVNENQFCDDWVQHIKISPLGGYLTYEVVDCPSGHPIQFTIVGADSGRLIRDNLPGVSPRWDHIDQQIVFQLTEGESMSSGEHGKQGLQQLAMYSLHANDLIFFNRIANGFNLYNSPLFSEDNAYLIYPVKNEQESRLVIHHIVQQLQQSFLLPEDMVVAETDQWAYMDEKALVVPIRAEAGYQLFIHHMTTELTEIIGTIDHWTNEDGNFRWFKSDSNAYVYYLKDGNLMQARDGSHRAVFKIPENKKMTDIDTWQEWLLVTVTTSKGEKQLYFVGL